MAKPGLGKSLGEVMQQANPPAASSASQPGANVSRGVASLLKAQPGEEETPKEPSARLPHPHKNLARISLWAADALLLGVAAYLTFGTGEPLSAARILLCLAALIMGAWLSVLAIRL